MKKIIDTIRQVRKEKKISQETIGKLIGLSTTGYASIEKGRANLRAEDALKICNFLKIDLNSLYNNEISNNNDITIPITITLTETEEKALISILHKLNKQRKRAEK